MKKENIDPKQDNIGQVEYITNHRIRPDDMTIFEAAEIGRAILQKDPNYKEMMENIRNFERSDGE